MKWQHLAAFLRPFENEMTTFSRYFYGPSYKWNDDIKSPLMAILKMQWLNLAAFLLALLKIKWRHFAALFFGHFENEMTTFSLSFYEPNWKWNDDI